MTETTPNMNLVLPVPLNTSGPSYAALIDTAMFVIDAHDHSTGNGVQITPAGLNISSDLTFAQHNATNLRTARLYNNGSFTPGTNDKTCLYALSNELHYIDGSGNDVQITLNGALDLSSSIALINIKDTNFTLEYFGDITRKAQFSVANVPASTQWTFILPTLSSGTSDTLVSLAATQTLTNKTLTLPQIATMTPNGSNTVTVPAITDTLVGLAASQTLTNKTLGQTVIQSASELQFNNSGNTFHTSLKGGANTGNYVATLPIADGASGQVLTTNGSGQWSWVNNGQAAANVAANDSNVVFVSTDNHYQVCLPTVNRTYQLPTTSVPAGDVWTFENRSTTAVITIQTSNTNTLVSVFPQTSVSVVSLIATPVTSSDWVKILMSSDTIKGKTTGGSPVAGYLGERLVSSVLTNTNWPGATTVTAAMTSLSLTAGVWDVTLMFQAVLNGATMSSAVNGSIVTSSSANGTSPDNSFLMTPPTGNSDACGCIAAYRVTISSTTTYYGTLYGVYSAGTPQYKCRLSAVRVA